MPDQEPTHRVTIDFSREAYETLTGMATALGVTNAEILCKAIGLTRFVLKEQQRGCDVIAEDPPGFINRILGINYGKRRTIINP